MPDRVLHQTRMQEVATDEYAQEVYVRDAWSAGIGLGRAYIVSTGRIALAVAGNLRATIENPATNTRTATILGWVSFATATGWPNIRYMPTTGLPATAPRPHLRLNRHRGDPTNILLRVDTDATVALSGGEDTGVVLGSPGGSRVEVKPLGLILAPGETYGVNVPFAGAADATMAIYVTEE